MGRRLRVALILGSLAVPLAGSAQQTPTFRSGVEYVEVDAIVTDGAGQFVRDLTKDDFQVLEDGKSQTISDFTLIDIPVERFDKPLYAPQPIEPDVRSNDRPFDGRVYVMLIDDLHIAFGSTARVKAAARLFIQQRLGANDVMAVLHTAGGDRTSQEFTNSKRRLLAAVDGTQGRALATTTSNRTVQYRRTAGDSADDPEDAERARNAQTSLGLLREVADWFQTVRGRRKAILFVSEGIDYDISQVIGSGSGSGLGPLYSGAVLDATREAVDAAMRSNVSIFGIDPQGLVVPDTDVTITDPVFSPASYATDARLSADSLKTLSDETGGFATVGRNDLAGAFDRIVADNSSYYVLAYYPLSDRRDGRFHKFDVRVNRPGLTVRARRGYLSPKGKAPAAPVATATGPSLELRDALNSPLPVAGLAMAVSLAPFKGTAANASVFFTAEFRGRNISFVKDNTLEFSYLAIDPGGKIRGGRNERVKWNLRPDTKVRAEEGGFRLLNRIDLPPGRYQVRIGSRDLEGGAVGAVTYDLDVPDFYKLPFSISGVVLTSLANGAIVTLKPDEQMAQVLPAPPVAGRAFAQDDEIALFAEVYDNAAGSPHTVDIATTITADDGKVVFKTGEERSSKEIADARGGYGYSARVPLNDILPGSYILTVEARSRLRDAPAATRQVPITVTASATPR